MLGLFLRIIRALLQTEKFVKHYGSLIWQKMIIFAI